MLKRIMGLPKSTPTWGILKETGNVDTGNKDQVPPSDVIPMPDDCRHRMTGKRDN